MKTPLIEANTYVPDLTAPVTWVNGTTATNPSTVNTSTDTFTLNVTGSDTGGSGLAYFEVFVSIDGQPAQQIGPAIPAGAPDSNGYDHAAVTYQGLVGGPSHLYRFYSIGIDGAGNVEAPHPSPNDVTFLQEFSATPPPLEVTGFSVEHGSPSRSYVRYLDLTFDATGSALQSIVDSVNDNANFSTGQEIRPYKYDLNGDASSKTQVSLQETLSVIDHVIEIDFGKGGIGGNPNSTAADGYYELDIVLPNGQIAVHYFDRLLGDVAGDGIVDQNDLNEIAAEINESSQLGWTPLSADVTGAGTVTAFDLTLATRLKGRKLGPGLSLG